MVERYPLCWPVGYTRTENPASSRFDYHLTLAKARDGLIDELRKLNGESLIISTNVELRLDGFPYSNRKPPQDKGVAIYFLMKNEQVVLACDSWNKVADNLHAVRKTVGDEGD